MMIDLYSENKNVGEIVAEDYRTAAVFHKYGIDFCCKGGRTLNEACERGQISMEELLADLERVTGSAQTGQPDFQTWPAGLLADYIEQKHHRYIRETVPSLIQFLEKIFRVHGARHPELPEINEEFVAASHELAMHMKKEELILFPYIKKMQEAVEAGSQLPHAPFGTVQNPVRMMMEEHETEGARFRKIAGLSDHYNPPGDACRTYRVAYSLLKEFEQDLHFHIHLENNILFPMALALEQKLNNSFS